MDIELLLLEVDRAPDLGILSPPPARSGRSGTCVRTLWRPGHLSKLPIPFVLSDQLIRRSWGGEHFITLDDNGHRWMPIACGDGSSMEPFLKR
eukprot:241511-Pyramimonas_sp.AAC.1